MPSCCAGSARARCGLTCMLCVCTLCACAARVRVCLQDHGGLPLHVAAWKNASERVVQALLDAHPRGAKATCVSGNGAGVGARACVVWGGVHPPVRALAACSVGLYTQGLCGRQRPNPSRDRIAITVRAAGRAERAARGGADPACSADPDSAGSSAGVHSCVLARRSVDES